MTYTEQLAEINTAITRILTAGQDISRGGARVRQGELDILLAERKRLEDLIAAESAGTDTPVWRHGLPVRSR